MRVKRLSAIDVQWPAHIPRLVRALEDMGYARFWTTEHHSSFQSASPLVLAGIAAASSSRIRVGTAGVMLGLYSPLKVNEDIRLLELLYPGRVDLGVVAAVPSAKLLPALVAGGAMPSPEGFAARLQALLEYLDGSAGVACTAGLPTTAPTPVWLCGTSRRSAALAGEHGLAFAFQDHERNSAEGPEVVDAYRQAFRPSPALAAPEAVVVGYGMCAESAALARQHWFPALGLPPNFVGTPADCAEVLEGLAERYGVDELVVQSIATDIEARLRSYRLLAEALGIGEVAPSRAVAAR